MSYGYRWGNHHHRGAHFSPFPLLFGLFILFAILKLGLLLPLLIIGGLVLMSRSCGNMRSNRGGWGWDEAKMREWGEKAKREFDSWDKPKRDRPYTYVDADDKPKRGDDGFDYV